MSTWISKSGLVAACLAVAGCDDTGAGFLSPPAKTGAAPLEHADLAGGSVRLTPPEGYCVDPGSLRARRFGASFALVADCVALSAEDGLRRGEPVVMTVTVSRPVAEARLPTVSDLIQSVAPDDVVGRESRRGLALVQVETQAAPPFAGAGPRYWRGAALAGDRLVGLALYAPEGVRGSGAEGAGMLAQLAGGLRATRPSAAAPEEPTAEAAAAAARDPAPGADADAPQGLGALFRGLLNP